MRNTALPIVVALFLVLSGCNGEKQHKQTPVAIQKDDTCAVCGMYITKHPGPRGEAYMAGYARPLKFGSIRDFFAYVTQPDVRRQLQSLFVQDVSRIDWGHPSNAPDTFINARKAYYVGWQPLPGAMGPDFAAFAKQSDAEEFIKSHGGALLRFDQITPAIITDLKYKCPTPGEPLYAIAKNCVQKPASARADEPGMKSDIPKKTGGTPRMDTDK